MTEDQAKAIIAQAFKALSDEHRGNLRWHAENGTRVFCGTDDIEWAFVSDSCHGSPSALASTRRQSFVVPTTVSDAEAWEPVTYELLHATQGRYYAALAVITEPVLRELMRKA